MKSTVKLSLPLLVVFIFFTHCSSGRTLNQLIEKSDQGNVAAQVQLASMYKDRKDYVEALKWYQKAARRGYGSAQINLGIMYEDGHGVGQDYAEALKW